ncbi:hypothetical protein L228DRAFT_248476 [Xylona heveae TC161]|uniref:Pentatricopeptide repeat domain-containing protein n=1 Tax=Xylona heveae (strain CBS 132557 / TC161) TaxID=1328760 RepID=A0A165G527_XYLHT|nr:hypothetical protein L228DRAFT_248476 [Xylona heveae TC161]KZF21747.1 hypothetical protein L228DRAFT_248476 [Xylona heveae TC161]
MRPALQSLRTWFSPCYIWKATPPEGVFTLCPAQLCRYGWRQYITVKRAFSTRTAALQEESSAHLRHTRFQSLSTKEPCNVHSSTIRPAICEAEGLRQFSNTLVTTWPSIGNRFDENDTWVQCVEDCRRIYGLQGMADIWRAVVEHGRDLPTEGRTADRLWTSLLELGFAEPSVLIEIYIHSLKLLRTSGKRWTKLYNAIVGHYLIEDPGVAYKWHKRLQTYHPTPADGLRELVRDSLKHQASLGVFRRIYLEHEHQKIYSTIIPILCDDERYTEALKWHKLLKERGDLPISSTAAEPLLKYLALYGDKKSLREVTQSLVKAGVSFAASTPKVLKPNTFLSREMMNRALGEIYNIQPKTFSDEFCARLFATRAFSVNAVIGGLRILGVDEIGPISFREIAVRSPAPQAIKEHIAKLNAAGIDIGPSVFSRCIEKFAIQGEVELLNDLLATDQHPDALQDRKLQERLLTYHHKRQDWRQFRMTLAVLTVSGTGDLSAETWNVILRSHIALGDLTAAQQTIRAMRQNKVLITAASSQCLLRASLRDRRTGKRPISLPDHRDDLSLVATLWLDLLRSGGVVAPSAWTEILRRLGMSGRMDELEKLALWLMAYYSPSTSRKKLALFGQQITTGNNPGLGWHTPELPRSHPKHPLKLLFPKALQGAIITWGFRTLSEGSIPPNRLHSGAQDMNRLETIMSHPWCKGLLLLRALKNEGAPVHTGLVRRVCNQNFRMLYGSGRSAVEINRKAAARNPFTLEEMMKAAQNIWGSNLFVTDEHLPKELTRSSSDRHNFLQHLLDISDDQANHVKHPSPR